MSTATLIPVALLGGPLCGALIKLRESDQEAEVHFGPTREIYTYRPLGETDRTGTTIFKFTGLIRPAET